VGALPSLPSAIRVELEQNPEVVTLKKREAAARHLHEAAAAKSEWRGLLKRLERDGNIACIEHI
jgi:hypothetical protein